MTTPYTHHVLTLVVSAQHVMTLHYTHRVVTLITSQNIASQSTSRRDNTIHTLRCNTHRVRDTLGRDNTLCYMVIRRTCLIFCNCLDSFYIIAAANCTHELRTTRVSGWVGGWVGGWVKACSDS